MILLHGTTLQRANSILANGPDPAFQEPGGLAVADGFSCTLQEGSEPLGSPLKYAIGKSIAFPNEGGPAIVEMDVPDEIVGYADAPWLPIRYGVIQFDYGCGLEELLAVWDTIPKSIIQPRLS